MLNLRYCLLALSAMMLLFAATLNASAFTITNVYLNNTLYPGQPLNASQPPSSAQWTFNLAFNASGNQPYFTTLNSSVIDYKDSLGRTITASYPLRISLTPNPGTAIYLPNASTSVPIYLVSSNITLGTVYQGQVYQNATVAPACQQDNLYTEWDLFVQVQPSILQSGRNIVVGRVCIYTHVIGTASILQQNPKVLLSGNLTLGANGQSDNVSIPDNATYAVSADKLVSASWQGNYMSVVQAPNGSAYAQINSTQEGIFLQNIGTYQRWYSQYYKFTQGKIPRQKESYSPTSVGILSNSCNLISSTDLTNKSLMNTVNCMNSTASLYYSLSNQLSLQLMRGNENLSGYPVQLVNFSKGEAFAISLPSQFTSNPYMDIAINGQFLGYTIPGGTASIISAASSPIGIDGNGNLMIDFVNVGNTPGIFTVSLRGCPTVSVQKGVSYQVNASQAVNITVPITAQNANLGVNASCSVVVTSSNGGGESRNITISSETPNQFITVVIQRTKNALCNSDGVFTQWACGYI